MTRPKINPALAQLVQRVKPFLLQYLTDHGIAVDDRGWFKCINPDHPDRNPSMHMVPSSNGTVTKCFSCGCTADIFKAHTFLEGRPKAGPGWVYQNLYDLARRYGVDFEEFEPTEQELLLMRLMQMYQDAADIMMDICQKEPDTCFEHTRRRGISDEVCIEMGAGSVPWKSFLSRMKASGHELDFMKKYDLTNDMFDREHVTFTIRDKAGMVVGFARRWTEWDTDQQRLSKEKGTYYPPKFLNTGANVPFFQKETILYGLDSARKENYRRLDIAEGYFDVLGFRQAGIRASVCACGTALSESQVMQAQECGFSHLNWVGDADAAGIKAALKSVEMMSGREGLKATVTFLPFPDTVPEKDRDPDTFLRMYGADAYFKLPEYSGFEWKLDTELRREGFDLSQIASKMVPLILNEKDRIQRGKLIKILCDRTGVSEDDVRAEIKKREDAQVDALATDLDRGLKRAKDSVERQRVIEAAYAALQTGGEGTVDVSVGESARAGVMAFQKFETPIQGLRGYRLGWDQFDKDFDGFPKEQEVIGIGGPPNCGKSAFATNAAVNLLQYNPGQLSVIYHIMDDPRDVAIAKIMSCLTGLPIRMVRRAVTDIFPHPGPMYAYTQAKTWVMDKMSSGELVIKGQEMGCGTDIATRLIDNTLQKTGKRAVYIADSLHNIEDEGGSDDRRNRFVNVASWAQNVSDTRRITMLFTCELTKEGMKERPRLYQTAETSKIAYAFKAVGMVWNALHILREKAQEYWIDTLVDPTTQQPTGDKVKRPIIELIWEKNKVSEYKGSHYFRFWDHSARVEPLTFAELQQERMKAASTNLTAPNLSALGSFQQALPHAPGALK